MKQFRILLMTLMFTIFSFASVSQAEEFTFDEDVGIENVQEVLKHYIVQNDSLSQDGVYLIVKKDVATSLNTPYFGIKFDPYKYMSIALSIDTVRQARIRRLDNLIYYKQIKFSIRTLKNTHYITV